MFPLYYLFISIYWKPKPKRSQTSSATTARGKSICFHSVVRTCGLHRLSLRRSRIKSPLGVRESYMSSRTHVFLVTYSIVMIVKNMSSKKKGLHVCSFFRVRYSERLIFVFAKFISKTGKSVSIPDSKFPKTIKFYFPHTFI